MQIAKYDFAEKAAAFKAVSLSCDSEYDESRRVHWLTLNALHAAYDNIAGAANKLENIDQDTPEVYGAIRRVVTELNAIEALLAEIDIERAGTDAIYAGSKRAAASLARTCAENVNQLSIAITQTLKALSNCAGAYTKRSEFAARQKRSVAVVKGNFTHTRGGMPVRFYAGEHCIIDTVLEGGDMRIADGNGNTSVYFTKDEVERLFDVVEA